MSNDLREQARQLWEQSGGKMTLRAIAGQLGIPLPTVKSWKQRDGWGKDARTRNDKKDASKKQADASRKRQARANTSIARMIDQTEALHEWEKDFCLHYTQCYNATQAAWRTGRYSTYNSAKQNGYAMLRKPVIQEEIKRLKAVKRAAILADGDDLIELHMRIAFADMGDYAVWAYNKRGGNRMAVLQSTEVDTQVVREVSESKEGFKIRLRDSAESMAFLERFFLLNPMDRHKQDFDRKKLDLEQRKIETDSRAAAGTPYIPDAVWRELMNPAYAEHLEAAQPTQIFFGGSSSGKSFGILGQRTIRDMLRGERNYLICRKTGRTLRNSAFNEIRKCIGRMALEPYFQVNKTDMVITCRPTGCQILFAGLDDVEKVKSITPAQGVLTDVVIEEATEAEYDDFKQLTKRLRGGDESIPKRVTLLFNPILQDHWIYENFFAGVWDDSRDQYDGKDLLIRRTTYKDNRWLTAEDVAKLEGETDKYYYEVYTLGRWGVLGNLIFTDWEVRDLADVAQTTHQSYNGLDFGFFPDPAAYVRAAYNRAKKEVYVFRELGGTDLTNDLLAEQLKPVIRREVLTCDSAEPKSIQELNNFGITAVPAVKGPGSLEFGIKWLQRQKILVDSSCRELILELRKYKYREDRNGRVLPEPVDRNNHYIDALRYALESIMVETRVS